MKSIEESARLGRLIISQAGETFDLEERTKLIKKAKIIYQEVINNIHDRKVFEYEKQFNLEQMLKLSNEALKLIDLYLSNSSLFNVSKN